MHITYTWPKDIFINLKQECLMKKIILLVCLCVGLFALYQSRAETIELDVVPSQEQLTPLVLDVIEIRNTQEIKSIVKSLILLRQKHPSIETAIHIRDILLDKTMVSIEILGLEGQKITVGNYSMKSQLFDEMMDSLVVLLSGMLTK